MNRLIFNLLTILIFSNLSAQIPGFNLSQNYPNPFDTSGTNIPYDLPISCSNQIWIEDSTGNLVKNLLSGQYSAGIYRLLWNARDDSGSFIIPGIYIAKMLSTLGSDTLYSDSISMEFSDSLQFILFQNEPNPFDTSGTVIRYELETACFNQLWIEDNMGNLVIMLISQFQAAGGDFITWYGQYLNGNYVPSGRYTYMILSTLGEDTLFSDSLYMDFQSIVAIEESMNNLVLGFELKQNYPNPFNPATTIEFSLPRSSFVHLEVFDITGKKVAGLIEQRLSGGSYKIHWDASHLSSGVYLYRFQSEHFVQTKKLILIK